MSDIQAMANTPEQTRDFLRGFLKSEIEQKIRLEETLAMYEIHYDVMTENVVDQAETVRSFQASKYANEPAVAAATEQAMDRLKTVMEIKERSGKAVEELTNRNEQMTLDGQAHMMALSEIEIEQGGFVEQIFGTRMLAEHDEATGKITFQPGGSASTFIGTRLSSWKDSSQMSITKLGGVKS